MEAANEDQKSHKKQKSLFLLATKFVPFTHQILTQLLVVMVLGRFIHETRNIWYKGEEKQEQTLNTKNLHRVPSLT